MTALQPLRYAFPLGAGRHFGPAFHAQPCSQAAVAELGRSFQRSMRLQPLLFAVVGGLFLSACQSTFGPHIGMTEKQWLHRTLVGDLVYMEGSVKAYRSGGAYYYFKDGVLVKIDQGIIPAQKIEMDIRSEQKITSAPSGDLYSELKKLDQLRKDGIITDEEFQAQKKKLLDQKK